MTRRFPQSLGALTLVLLVVAALVAVIVGQPTIRVQFGPEPEPQAARGPDPVALVAEDVTRLRSDLDALSAALSKAFNGLAEGLTSDSQARAEARREDQAGWLVELTALRAELTLRDARIQELVATLSTPAPEPETRLAPEHETQSAPEPAVALEPQPEPEPPKEEPAAGASFLAFELPSRALDFEHPQRFAIVPSLSRVGFDATSTLHDFTGATHAVAGELETVLARPGELSRGSVRVEAAQLDTGEEGRDEAMREHLGVAEHPQIAFTWSSFEPTKADVQAREVAGTARGEITIRGVARAIAMPVRVGVDAGQRVKIEGEVTLDMNDFGVEVPKKLGVIKVDPEVKIWIALRARHVGAASMDDDAH